MIDEATKQEFKDYMFQAVQAGKKETSDLADFILKKQEGFLEAGINKYVNGKIDNIKNHLLKQDKDLDDVNSTLKEIKDEQTRIRETTQPLIDSRKTVLNVGRFIIWTSSILTAIGVIVLAVMSFNKLIK